MANKNCRKIRTRREQAEQDSPRGGMLLEQREERGARADCSDKFGEVHQRQIGIGQPANLVEENRSEPLEQFTAARTGRSVRGTARKQIEMARAFVWMREAEFTQVRGRGLGLVRGIPRQLGGVETRANRFFLSARQRLAELIRD